MIMMINRNVVIDEEKTDENYGFEPRKRPIDQLFNYGLIPVDKPPGPTSHEVVSWIRKILNVKKAGHSGTLDPQVTGLLPIGMNDATKALTVLLLGPKEYHAVARFHESFSETIIKKIFSEFTGEIYQRPPQKSAVKRQVRTRTVHNLELLEIEGTLVLLKVSCQSGTYIRKLIYDMGEVLTSGATMIELRRTRVSNLTEADGLVKMHDLLDAAHELNKYGSEDKIRLLVKPIEEAISFLKSVVIRDSAVDAICHGAKLAIPGILNLSPKISSGDIIAIHTLKGELVAIGEGLMSTDEVVNAEKGIAFLTKRVIMKARTYPKLWHSKNEV
jgi:H/ACA ribonucleoprotein complex subunit 4